MHGVGCGLGCKNVMRFGVFVSDVVMVGFEGGFKKAVERIWFNLKVGCLQCGRS